MAITTAPAKSSQTDFGNWGGLPGTPHWQHPLQHVGVITIPANAPSSGQAAGGTADVWYCAKDNVYLLDNVTAF